MEPAIPVAPRRAAGASRDSLRCAPVALAQGDAVPSWGTDARRMLAMIAMGSFALAVWLLQHPYTGIRHDSTLYTLFALAKLHPDTLGGDIFLRFGSQDKYTAFTPLYALAIVSLGLEHAAAFLTFASQAALLVYAWLLARRFMSPPMATLGVALLAVMPGEYGPGDMFHLMEGFLTPRASSTT